MWLLCVGFVFGQVGAFAKGGEASSPVTLDIPVFAGGYGTDFYEQTARLFEQARPDVRVHLYGDPRIADKVRVRVIDGHLPDATLTGGLLWPALIRAGRVVDLTPYLDQPNWEGDKRWGDTFVPGALDAWKVDGGTYGLPFGYAVWTLFYDRALFRRHGWSEPRTWDEFFALCDKIQAAGVAPLALAGTRGLYPEALQRAAFYQLAGAGGWQALQDLTPGIYTDTRFVRAAGVLQRATTRYTLRGWEGASHTGAQLAFLEGRAAMTISGSWFINEMRARLPAGFELGTMNFPVFADEIAPSGAIQTGSDCFFAFETGDKRREQTTIDFLRFLTSRERAAAWAHELDAPVAVQGVPAGNYSATARPTAELIAHAPAAYNMPQDMLQAPAIRQALTDARFRLMTGELTPEAYGERLEEAARVARERVANPDLVEVRHPLAAAVLVGGLVATALGAVWSALKRRGTRTEVRGTRMDGRMVPVLRLGNTAGFVGPALGVYAAFTLLPGLGALVWAFTRWDGISARSWVGTLNFRWLLLESDVFWVALRNNLFLVAVPPLVVVPVALGLAMLLHRGVWGARTLKVLFLMPNLLGGIAATLLWLQAYEPHGGLVSASLAALGDGFASFGGPGGLVAWLRGFDGFAWLSPEHLYAALVPIYLWMACGFNLVLYLAAMEGVPAELYEAARLDGAGAWEQFRTVTLPLIWDVLVVSAVFLVIGGLNAFELVWLLTQQDPVTSVHTLGTLLVTTMFKELAVGRATALAVVLLVLVLAASGVVMRVLRREAVER